jgi:hypothetical protein
VDNSKFERKTLSVIEDLTVTRTPLRLLESPWQRQPLFTLNEYDWGNAAGRLAGAVWGTKGHYRRKLHAIGKERADDLAALRAGGAPEHQSRELEGQYRDKAAVAGHRMVHTGAFGRLGYHTKGFLGLRPGEKDEPPSPTAAETPAAATAPAAPPVARLVSPPPSQPGSPVASTQTTTSSSQEPRLQGGATPENLARANRFHAMARSVRVGNSARAKAEPGVRVPAYDAPKSPAAPVVKSPTSVTDKAKKVISHSGGVAPTGLGTHLSSDDAKKITDIGGNLLAREKGKLGLSPLHATTMRGKVLTKEKSLSGNQRAALNAIYRMADKTGMTRTQTAKALRAARKGAASE